MMQLLAKKSNFYSPNLNLNMRNSSEVGELARSLKSRIGSTKITNVIESLPTAKSSITSSKPTLFPILRESLHENYPKIIEHATEKGEMNVIRFDDEVLFDFEQIKQGLLNCNVKEEDIFVHTLDSNNTKEDIKDFLRNPNGFLICQAELFTGMEADSVVYLVSEFNDKNVRVNVMRACSKLNIVYCYRKDDSDYIDFLSAKLDPTFMNGCDEVVERYVYKCLTCKKNEKKNGDGKDDDILVCKPCFIGCHRGHEIIEEDVENDLETKSVRCECKTKFLNCIL